MKTLATLTGVLFAASGLVAGATEPPTEPPTVSDLLARPVITPDLPLSEVQAYTEAHVLPMPAVTTAEEWEVHANRMRDETLKRVVYRGEAAAWRDAETKVEWKETLGGGDGYRIRTLRFEALPGLWIPALLYEPVPLKGKVPVVLNVNGHDRKNGKASKQKQRRCINQAKRGMMALNLEWLGMGQLHTEGFGHYRINQIDLCGTSGVAVHFLAMKRGIDLLLAHDHADPDRLAVTGLSGGGWQTIFISALDLRVTLANPVAGYSSFRTRIRHFDDLGDSEQTPVDLGTTADYAQLTAMRAPRPTLLTFNAKDNCCFRADHALEPLLQAAQPIYKLYGKPKNLRSHVNEVPGTHNFNEDNRQQLYRMLGDFFFPNNADYDVTEIACDEELKSKDELTVALPSQNADFHSLALDLAKALPRDAKLPASGEPTEAWQAAQRKALVDLLRLESYDVKARSGDRTEFTGGTATPWKLRLGDAWTVPAVELTPPDAKSTVLVLADGGRKQAAADVERLLGAGHRVLAVDPFYFGESTIRQKDFLFGLVVSAVGKRPLGLQVAQIAAIAEWSAKQHGDRVELLAVGPRTSLIGLTTAAVKPSLFSQVTLQESFGSLKEVLEKDLDIRDGPELFCFGLLEQFDLLQLAALAAPTGVTFTDPSDRVKKEFAPLRDWYRTQGLAAEPLQWFVKAGF